MNSNSDYAKRQQYQGTFDTVKVVSLMALVLFSGSALGQDPTETVSGESLVEEVFENRLNTLQDSLFMRQEQLDAANFLVNQIRDETVQLQDSVGNLATAIAVLVDSIGGLNIAQDQLTTENMQYQTQLSALSDSLAISVKSHADLLSEFEVAQLISDSIAIALTATQTELFIADSSSMSYADTLATLRANMNKLSNELLVNEEGMSGMYERLKSVMTSVNEGAYDTTKDERYLEALTNIANYKASGRRLGRLFGGGPDKYINRFKFSEFEQYLNWIELEGHTPEVFNYLGALYQANDEPVIATLVYLKNLFLFPESQASAAAADALNGLVEKNGELGHMYYEVVLNSDSLNVGDEKFYRYLQYLDQLHRLYDAKARRWYLSESALFLGHYPGIFQSDKIIYWQAETYHALEEYHNEILVYQKIPMLFPESAYIPDCKFNMAEVTANELELYDVGAEGYSAFRAEFPDHALAPAALLAEATIYSQNLKDYRRASEALRELADTYPESNLAPVALFNYATLSKDKLASKPQALAVYEEILTEYGQDEDIGIPALEGLASISKRSGQFEAAVVYYLDIHDRFPESNEAAVRAILAAAEIYEKNLKNLDAAIHTLHIVLDNYPNFPGKKSVTKRVQKLQKKKG